VFRPEWIRYYTVLPTLRQAFAFVDPAIGMNDNNDYTAIVVAFVDQDQNWYVEYAKRERLNPSQTIAEIFRIAQIYKPQCIGIEDVAYQRALVHFTSEAMRARNEFIPLFGVKRHTNISKNMRIEGLVPRFEWGKLFLKQGHVDLEQELFEYPRGSHDDLIDALASLNEIVSYPQPARSTNEAPHQHSPNYESWYARNLVKQRAEEEY
jgi:predicted phage terminase large subunit-like protein